mmetsp:Transcript_21777/g.64225  ORF Transcript_21777/g.64225 Transcript_21777/m.64225 type:complete len:351 (+) Transcript_21777:56-1108(+)
MPPSHPERERGWCTDSERQVVTNLAGPSDTCPRNTRRRQKSSRRSTLRGRCIGFGGGFTVAVHVLPVRNKIEDDRVRGADVGCIADVKATALDLDRLALWEQAQRGLAYGIVGLLRALVNPRRVLVHLVLILEVVLSNEVVEVDELHRHILRGRARPSELPLGSLDVAGEVESALEAEHRAGRVPVHAIHHGVAPVHERHLLAVGDEDGVGLLDENLAAVPLELAAELGRLLVLEHGPRLGLRGQLRGVRSGKHKGHGIGLGDGGVAWRRGVDDLAVLRPDLVPLHEVCVLRCALQQDEGAQALHRQAPPEDAAHRGHARVRPPVHAAHVDEPVELALAQQALLEVDARE